MSMNKLRRTFADELKVYYDDKNYTSAHHIIIYWSIPLGGAGNSQARQLLEIQFPSELFLQAECARLLELGEKEEGVVEEEVKGKKEVEVEVEVAMVNLKDLYEQKQEFLDQLAIGMLEAEGFPMIEQWETAKRSTVREWGNEGIFLVGVRVMKGKFTEKKAYRVRVVDCCGDPKTDFLPPTLGEEEEPMLNPELGQLRYHLATDYTIQLLCHETGKILSTFTTSRFLLGLRIPYFRNMFSSGMADSDTCTSKFYTDTMSLEALMVICRYVYLLDTMPLFWFYTTSKSTENNKAAAAVHQLRKKIELYISPPHWRSHPSKYCESYLKAIDSSTGDIFPPPSIIIHVVNVIKAADYLGLDDLKLYMLAKLKELAHDFSCSGQGCAKLLPQILDTIYSDMNIPKSVLEPLVQHLGQTQNIMKLWKRPLIMVRPEALEYLVGKIKNKFVESQCGNNNNNNMQGQSRFKNVGGCYLLYEKLVDLHMQVEAKAKSTATEWQEKLITPLHDFCIQHLASNITWFPTSYSPSETDVRLLGDIISSRYMVKGDCEGFWRLGLEIGGELHDDILKWFKRNWLNLSLTPPPPLQRGLNAGGVYSNVYSSKKLAAASEPNFFSTWSENYLKVLALALGVEVDDLLARSHKRRPPETPMRSVVGRDVYQERGLVVSGAKSSSSNHNNNNSQNEG